MKSFLKYIGWILIALIIAILLLPYLFKQQLIETIRTSINDQINAEITIEDADLSFIKSFPQAQIQIKEMAIKNEGRFKGTTLFNAKYLNLETDIGSLIKYKEGIKIINLDFHNAQLNLIVDDYGKVNYDILKERETSSNSEIFGEIESYTIHDGLINYANNQNGLEFELEGIQHTGTGNFRDVVFELFTATEIKNVNATYGSLKYLKDAVLKGDLDIIIDLNKDAYSFTDNLLYLNDMALSFKGDMLINEESYDFNIQYEAPNNKVSDLFSILPNAYTADYKNLKSEGIASFKGNIKGTYDGSKGHYPKMNTTVMIDQGQVQYPGFKYPIEDINLSLLLDANQGNWNDFSFDLSDLKFRLNEETFIGKLKGTTLFNNPAFEGFMDGKIDLQDMSKAFPMPDYEDIKGQVKADVRLKARHDDIINENYGKIEFDGNFLVENLSFLYNNTPVTLTKSNFKLDPDQLQLDIENFNYSRNHLEGNIEITNPLSVFIESEKKIKFNSVLKSDYLDLDTLQLLAQRSSVVEDSIQKPGLFQKSISDIDVDLNLFVKEGRYDNNNIDNVSLKGNFLDDNLNIENASLVLNGTQINSHGQFSNLIAYISKGQTLSGKLFIESPDVVFEKIQGVKEGDSSSDSILIIPKNIDITIYPSLKNISYGKYRFSDFDAKIVLSNGIASIIEGNAKVFEGKINFDGFYDSSVSQNPNFDFKYNLSELSITKMFSNSRMFKTFAPVGKYLDGVFNSTFVFSGPLTNKMIPDLYKITASGIFETVEGKITGLKPLEMLGDALGIEKIKQWKIRDSKNWFEIKDGTVHVKETDYNFEGMEFKVAGTHSISQQINYLVKAKIPRELLKKGQIGKTLNNGFDFIINEAAKKGLNIENGDFIFLDIFMTGSIDKPNIRITPIGSGGQSLEQQIEKEVNQKIDKIKDDLKTEANKKSEAVKDTVSKIIKEKTETVKDTLIKVAEKEVEKVTDKIKDRIKQGIDSSKKSQVINEIDSLVGKELEEIMGDKAQKEIDSIKAIIKGWSPFKKKKEN